jgi:hypothetical protein
MTKRQPASVDELTLEYLVQALAAESDLDRDELNQEVKQQIAATGLQAEDLDFGLDDDQRRDLSRYIIKEVEQDGDEKIKELLSESREGAESGAMEPVTMIAAGAAVGFVILCAKLKRVDLAKRVLTFDKMPDSLGSVLKALIGIV